MRSMSWLNIVLLALMLAMLHGCAAGGWLGNATAGGKKTVHVEARYRDLANHSVAVLVSADEYVLYQHPQAELNVCRSVSAKIAENLPTVTVKPPSEVIAFQKKNPYWATLPYAELIENVGVERLVIVDLAQYTTHEAGNAHIWQGTISAEVSVLEAEYAATDRLALRENITTQYPEDTSIGLLNQDDQTIELATVAIFSRDAAGLFYDHDVEVD